MDMINIDRTKVSDENIAKLVNDMAFGESQGRMKTTEQIREIDEAIKNSSSKGEVMDLIQCKEVLMDEQRELE